MSVYRVTELIGTSTQSWEDAASRPSRRRAGRYATSVSPRLSRKISSWARMVDSPIERNYRSRSSMKAASRPLTR